MRRRPMAVGAAMATAGVAVVLISVAVAVRAGDRWLDSLPALLGGVAIGGLLVVLGAALFRDLRRSPGGRRKDHSATTAIPYPSPQQDIGWAGTGSSSDCGGGGGGDCGGSGGGS